MSKKKLENKVVVVTGASSGVGRAIARRFGAEGAKVALIARDLIGLEDAASEIRSTGGQAMVLPLDVSQSTAMMAAADRVAFAWGGIDVWVNDAMVSVFAPVHETTPDEFRRVIEVNYLGYVHGTLAALKHMRPRDAGVIVQIGSAVAYRAIPLQSAYSASKAAIRGFTDSLRSELIHARSRIKLTHLQLPAVNTPQFDVVRSRMPGHPHPVPPVYQPEAIAAVALRAVLRPRREIWIGWPAIKAIIGQRIVPRFLDGYLARHAWSSQETRRLPPGHPLKHRDNLDAPVGGDRGARGPFTGEALPVAGARRLVARGLVAGVAGTLAVALAGWVERRLLGRRPVYAPSRLARRLFAQAARTPGRASAIGKAMRWTYGPLVGLVWSATIGRMIRRRWPATRAWPAGLALGAAVYLFELLALPGSGATRPLARWPAADRLLLAGHTAAFGLAAETTRRSLEPS
ncbi:MAG TPA: SDR family oxidoreductase [Polyangia bacterium]|nr:SDR family oxidoreductase [Polyangia bacterium]